MYRGNANGLGSDRMQAKLNLPKPAVHKSHPFLNQANHDLLLEYCQQRLRLGKELRDAELDRLVSIDKSVAGWMKKSTADQQRSRKKAQTGQPQATMVNLPLGYVHLDDMMTYFAQTFAPTRGMFYHTGKPDESDESTQMTVLMNNHAVYAGYYREVLLAIYSVLKYNLGGFTVNWSKESGPKLVKEENGEDKLTTELRWQGNRLEAIDNYNFLRDPEVHPTKLHTDGEFGATVKTRSFYWLQQKASQGAYYNCDQALKEYQGDCVNTYYRFPPREAQMDTGEGGNSGGTDWIAVLSAQRPSGKKGAFEIVDLYIRLDPTDFGLIPGSAAEQRERKRYEIWRISILNDKYIIEATYMKNIHGYLPFFMGVLNDDLMGTSQKSSSEVLTPLQDFASFLLNTHVLATRKKLWGLTVYDPTMVDLKQIPEGEVSATVPMNPEAAGKDIRTGIWQPSQQLETKQTMDDLESVMALIDQFFPTQSLPSQIASIDRAVDSQVAAVQQGANRRQQKAARLLDDMMFRPVRFAMYYNIIQFQPDADKVTDFYTGKPVQIDLQKLRNTDLPFVIGQGLKAIDRQAAAKQIQQIIFALIQAPQAAQRIDLLGLINYWVSMIDIDVDMKQFELAPATQAAPGSVDPAEAAAAESATGATIVPATNPQSITAPIYGS